MVLKEAYRYQNFLSKLINDAESYLLKRDFYTTTKQTHHRKKANPEAGDDETVVVEKTNQVDFTPNDVIDLLVTVLDEKQKLCDAISAAKKTTEIDIDSSLSMNKEKQGLVNILYLMDTAKDTERTTRGTDYKFNVDGNQVSYSYDVTEVTSIDFDRNNVRKLIKKYNNETDEISSKLDLIQITTEVDFTPTWDVHDTLETILAK